MHPGESLLRYVKDLGLNLRVWKTQASLLKLHVRQIGSILLLLSKNPRQKVLEYAWIQKYWMTRSADRITLCERLMKYCQSCQKLPTSQFSMPLAVTGAWSSKLEDQSSYLTTFNTPFGRYRYLRVPFGLNCSQDVFQRKIDETFEGMTGVTAIVDDILVFGKTRAEHDQNLRKVLTRAHERGIKLNADKVKIGVTEVRYFGNILTQNGLKIDEKKLSAIRQMHAPKDRSELVTILGMVTYLTRFALNLATLTAPLRNLLKKDVEFVWNESHVEAFQKIKDVLTDSPVLAYFNPKLDVTLQVDASKYGLGATLLQEGRPVSYASKTLTQTEIGYAQIEKEMLGILFGAKRFHEYIR